MTRRRAASDVQARIDLMTASLTYQTAAVWVEANPEGSVQELLNFLKGRAEAARRGAVEAEMRNGDLDHERATALVEELSDFWEPLREEIGA